MKSPGEEDDYFRKLFQVVIVSGIRGSMSCLETVAGGNDAITAPTRADFDRRRHHCACDNRMGAVLDTSAQARVNGLRKGISEHQQTHQYSQSAEKFSHGVRPLLAAKSIPHIGSSQYFANNLSETGNIAGIISAAPGLSIQQQIGV